MPSKKPTKTNPKHDFPQEVRLTNGLYFDAGQLNLARDLEDLDDGDFVATYELKSVGKVKTNRTIEPL